MRKLFYISVLLAPFLASFVLMQHNNNDVIAKEQPAAPPAVPVSVAEVVAKKIIQWDEFSGRFEAVEKAEIRPRVSGTIFAVNFEEGKMVSKGQELFTIDPRPYEAARSKANADLTAAKNQLELAQKEYDRGKTLLEGKVITNTDFDKRNSALQTAHSSVQAAEAALQSASLDVEYARIKAPISGRISRAELTVGNNVTAQNPPLLTTIVSTDPIFVSFDADEQSFLKYFRANGADRSQLKNIPVFVGLQNEDPKIKASIQSFDNQVNASSGTIRVRAIVKNPGGALVPGLFARVKLGGEGEREALLVNEQAIGTDQDKKFIFVVTPENKIEYRVVKLGGFDGAMRVVESGLQAGEKIVVKGLQKVRPSAVVIPEEVSMETLENEITGTVEVQ